MIAICIGMVRQDAILGGLPIGQFEPLSSTSLPNTYTIALQIKLLRFDLILT